MSKRILYSFASRSRPDQMISTLVNIRAFSTDTNYEVVLKLDHDDPLITGPVSYTIKHFFPEVRIARGYSGSKVEAINRDVPAEGWDILVNISDDQRFIKPGFDQIIRDLCGPDIFLHLPDQYAEERVSTMSIMGRAYYNRFGYIYHPSYKSFYCDEEATDVARVLGKHVLGPKSVIVHNHPTAGCGKNDMLYKRNQSYWKMDKLNYLARKEKGVVV